MLGKSPVHGPQPKISSHGGGGDRQPCSNTSWWQPAWHTVSGIGSGSGKTANPDRISMPVRSEYHRHHNPTQAPHGADAWQERRDEMVATAIFRWRQRRCAALRGPRGWWRCVGCPLGCLRRHAGRGLLRVACGGAFRHVASRHAAGSHLVPAGCCLRLAGDARPPAARHARTPRLRGAIGCRWLLVGGDGSRGVRRGARCGVGERRVEVVRVKALGAISSSSSSTRWIVRRRYLYLYAAQGGGN